ncbi:MAG: flagellar motor switch protein FliM, partial [bacterium]
ETLDQEEIDELLGSLGEEEESSGGEPEPEPETSAPAQTESSGSGGGTAAGPQDEFEGRTIKTYDFKRPDKFSKDQIRTLQMIHETFARSTTTELSAQLRSLASLSVASVDQLSYEEFMKVVPSPTSLAVIDMDPLEGKALFELDPALAFQIVDRLFGGTGETDPADIERELTDIEHSVIERIFMSLLNNLRDAWENIIDLRPRLEQIESNPQFVQIVPPNDMVVLITFDTKIGNVEGMANLCIPYVILGPVVDQLSATYWYSSGEQGLTEQEMDRLRQQMDFVEVPVSVQVGKTKVSASDLVDLEEGDILKLDTDMDEPFKLSINGNPKYDCRPGLKGRSLAVQVLDPIEEEAFIAELMEDMEDEMEAGGLQEGEEISNG